MSPGTDEDGAWLRAAIELSRLSPPTRSNFAVGALIVDAAGVELASGYTGEADARNHAEEVALAKLADRDLAGATVYSSLEPCTARKSRPGTCTDLILAAGIGRVVFALREPPIFADCHGFETLVAAGIEVVEIAELGPSVRAVNAHLLGLRPADGVH